MNDCPINAKAHDGKIFYYAGLKLGMELKDCFDKNPNADLLLSVNFIMGYYLEPIF